MSLPGNMTIEKNNIERDLQEFAAVIDALLNGYSKMIIR